MKAAEKILIRVKLGLATIAATSLLMVSQASWAGPIGGFGDGGAGLQGVLDGITQGGPSSVNVNTDNISDLADSSWQIGGSGGSVATLIIELAGFAPNTSMGVYDTASPSNTLELFDGSATTGAAVTLSILLDGSLLLNFVDTGVDFAANNFGYYIDTTFNQPSAGLWYSDSLLNSDGRDHMVSYQGVGDTIQIGGFAAGPWGPNEYVMAFEDLIGGGDRDFTDFVFLAESISPVPEPGMLALLGLGLLGLGVARRRKLTA